MDLAANEDAYRSRGGDRGLWWLWQEGYADLGELGIVAGYWVLESSGIILRCML